VLILSFSVNAQQVNILTEGFESGSTPLGWVTEGGNDANYISSKCSGIV